MRNRNVERRREDRERMVDDLTPVYDSSAMNQRCLSLSEGWGPEGPTAEAVGHPSDSTLPPLKRWATRPLKRWGTRAPARGGRQVKRWGTRPRRFVPQCAYQNRHKGSFGGARLAVKSMVGDWS